MSRIALITGNKVVNVIEADLAWAQTLGYDDCVVCDGTPVGPNWTYTNGQFYAPTVSSPPVEPEPPLRYAAKHTTPTNGQIVVNLPRTGMVFNITPRTAGAVYDGLVEGSTTVNGKIVPNVTVKFKKMKLANIAITGLVNLSLFETTPGAIEFDIIAELPE